MAVLKYICYSYAIMSIAMELGWLPGANYKNTRDIKKYKKVGFIDIDWKNYNYEKHLEAVKYFRPQATVARDIEDVEMLEEILEEANELSKWAANVIIVPKDLRLEPILPNIIPERYMLGYSVPSRYGGTKINKSAFSGRKVHLLGGHPNRQRLIADKLNVCSIDCNRMTIDAAFGDYFDDETFTNSTFHTMLYGWLEHLQIGQVNWFMGDIPIQKSLDEIQKEIDSLKSPFS
ncbi:DUF6610 family protein [Chloroflexota bacterium]